MHSTNFKDSGKNKVCVISQFGKLFISEGVNGISIKFAYNGHLGVGQNKALEVPITFKYGNTVGLPGIIGPGLNISVNETGKKIFEDAEDFARNHDMVGNRMWKNIWMQKQTNCIKKRYWLVNFVQI